MEIPPRFQLQGDATVSVSFSRRLYIDPASLDSCGRRKTAPRASRCADRSQNTAARKKYRPIGATFSESRQYWPPTGARSVALCTRVVARPRRRRAQRSPRKSARFAGRESKRTTPTDETRSRRPRRLRRLGYDREPRVVRSRFFGDRRQLLSIVVQPKLPPPRACGAARGRTYVHAAALYTGENATRPLRVYKRNATQRNDCNAAI